MKSKTTKSGIESTIKKSRGLFDHINHIREKKEVDYYKSLSEEEKKSFNKYMIIRILSMDNTIIAEMSNLSKYFDILPEESFYKLLISIVPRGRKFCPYIKNKAYKINADVLKCIRDTFKVGSKDAADYYSVLSESDSGIQKLIGIIRGFGYNEKEIEKMFD